MQIQSTESIVSSDTQDEGGEAELPSKRCSVVILDTSSLTFLKIIRFSLSDLSKLREFMGVSILPHKNLTVG